jgi:hypothetical protein
VSNIIITVNSKEPDRLFASTVRAMRRGLDLTVAQLARASGLARPSIEAIQAIGVTTPPSATTSRLPSAGCQPTASPRLCP